MHPESNLDSKIIDTITPRAAPESEQRVKRGAPGAPGVLASVRSAYLKSEIIGIRYNSLGDNDGERVRLARHDSNVCKTHRHSTDRRFLAGRQKQRARRPRSPEVVGSFSFGTKSNNGINPRSSARG